MISFGEGALVLSLVLNDEFRQASYLARHVNALEVIEFEKTWSEVKHIVLVAPHSTPFQSYMNVFREFLPESTHVVCDNKSVVYVIPLKDALMKPC